MSRQTSLKPHLLHKFLSGFFSNSDHRKGENIEDDWEYIEVLGQELAGIVIEEEEDGEVSEFGDQDFPSPSNFSSLIKTKCKILSRTDILQRLKEKISKVSTVLLLPRADAAILLHHFKWSVSRSEDEWLSREANVRKAVGLYDRHIVEIPDAMERACGICHDSFPGDKTLGVSCGHQFCLSCWTGYISNAISDGPGCLALRCPDPSCDAAVGNNVIEPLSSEEDKKKFEDYLIKAYLNCRKKGKWCPAPGCNYAVFLCADSDDSTVTCRCSYKFCWNCTTECHAPVDCDTVVKWVSEINAQSENWMFCNTRPCPLCQRLIQLNQDFKYLICDHCNFNFCCDCGGQWPGRGDALNYNCHICESSRPAGFLANDVCERAIAKSSLERFSHFYEGWAFNESSKANALTDLQLFQKVQLEMICAILSLPEFELDFLVEAQLQIVECHQLLKWMQVYGYFLTQDEHLKRDLFQFMEGEAKHLLNLLEKHLKELIALLYGDFAPEQFVDFRKKIVKLTSVARNYFNKLVEALEAGLPEVVSIPRPMMLKEERSTGRSASPSMSISTPNALLKVEMQDCLTMFDETSSNPKSD